jgi:hypothetical protein
MGKIPIIFWYSSKLLCIFALQFPFMNNHKAIFMSPTQDKKPVSNQRQAILAEKRAAALRANLKKRKDQGNARKQHDQNLEIDQETHIE